MVDICGTAVLTLDLQVHECEEVDLHARLSLVRTNSAAEQAAETRLRTRHREHDTDRRVIDASGKLLEPFRPHLRELLLDPNGVSRLISTFGALRARLAPVNGFNSESPAREPTV
jgi:hypothetical protein